MASFPPAELPARNEPCSCDSGRPFKHCCGAVIPVLVAPRQSPRALKARRPDYTVQAATQSVSVGPHPALNPDRSCGSCTACCDGWLTGTVRGHDMKPGVPCHFRGAGCCTIYPDRPENPCRSFFCAWRLDGNPFPDSFRPDQVGVIIVARQWRDRPGYELISAGRDPDDSLLNWMREFSTTTGSPFLYSIDGHYHAFGVPAFQEEMRMRASRGELPSLHDPVAHPGTQPATG